MINYVKQLKINPATIFIILLSHFFFRHQKRFYAFVARFSRCLTQSSSTDEMRYTLLCDQRTQRGSEADEGTKR